MESIYHTMMKIRNHEIDFMGRVKVSALFDMLQDAASVHADGLGYGYRQLSEEGMFWVLSWVKIEIGGFPGFDESVVLTTWPKCRHKAFAIRDVLFSDPEGGVFGRASTAWLMVDLRSKRLVRIDKLPRPLPHVEDKSALDDFPEKFQEASGIEKVYEKEVRYNDIDINRHVNNARYVDAVLDCFSEPFLREHRLTTMILWFHSESRFGDRLEIGTVPKPNIGQSHRVEARDILSGKTVFQASLEWEIR